MGRGPQGRAALISGAALFAAACCASALGAAPKPSHDPRVASLRFAACMRAHGVPHPDPDKNGDFHLTRAQEQRMKQVPQRVRTAAQNACFHHLQGLNNRPLSNEAKARAVAVLREVGRCMKGYGYELGRPVVKNMTHGRAFFGFQNPSPGPPTKAMQNAERTCEQRVGLARRLDAIIALDRSGL